jgi:hypothetical protein
VLDRVAQVPQLLGQAGQAVVDVADQVDLGEEVRVDLRRGGVDAHDPLVAVRVPVRGRVLDEVVADRDDHVGVLEARQRVVVRLQADGAQRVGVLVVQGALAHERLRDADPGGAGEVPQGGRGAGARDAVAGQHDRVDRAADDLDRPEDLLRRRLGPGPVIGRQGIGRDRRGHDVLRQLDVRRAGLLVLGDLEGLAHHLGDDPGVVEPGVPLRHRLEHRDDVDVLVGLLVHSLEIRLAGERHERRAVEERVRDGGDEVRRARAERAQAHAGALRQPAVHVGHVGPALFVSNRNEVHRRARERLVEVQRLLAGDAEYVLDALRLEALHEQIRRLALLAHLHLPVSFRNFSPASVSG